MNPERYNLCTREFMLLLRMNKTEFYEHKAAAGDNFPLPVGRGKNGFLWPFEECCQYASDLLSARQAELESDRQRLAEWVNPEA